MRPHSRTTCKLCDTELKATVMEIHGTVMEIHGNNKYTIKIKLASEVTKNTMVYNLYCPACGIEYNILCLTQVKPMSQVLAVLLDALINPDTY